MYDCGDEILCCFCIFLCYHPCALRSLLSIFFRLFVLGCAIRMGTKYCGSWKNFIKMLKLLSGALLICIYYCLVIYSCYIWESINYKSSQECCVGNFVFVDTYCRQSCESLQFRNLYETINVVVLEMKCLKLLKTSEFAYIGWTYNVIESYVLEWNLLYSLLEIRII
jgi:hypothetical protein